MTIIPISAGNKIANCQLQIANCKLKQLGSEHNTAHIRDWVGRGGQFTAHSRDNSSKTPSGSARNSSFIPHTSFFIRHKPGSELPGPYCTLPTAHCPLPTSRPAFTLVEVMLTLCLLVIISAMAWPKLEKTFSSQRLRKAADIVRTQWTKARVEAMRTGSIRVFRYQISGNTYRIDMLSTDPVALLTGTTTDTASNNGAQPANSDNAINAGSPQTSGGLDAMAPFFQQILPKDITFITSQTGLDPTAAAASSSTPAAADASSVDPTVANSVPSVGAGWSEPIYFYPDGTTSDSRLLLANKEGRTIELWLRGITGMVKIGDITAGGSL
jgi:hypothetical protein